jgi:flagellar hook-associated protein 3 FlgL
MTMPSLFGFLPPNDPSVGIRVRVDRLSQELSTERHADLGAALKADFSRLSEATHALQTFDARKAVLQGGKTWGALLQASLGAMSDGLERIGDAIPALLSNPTPNGAQVMTKIAEGVLNDMLSNLQGRSGGRSLFGNGDPNALPLPDAGTMLQDIRLATTPGPGGLQAAVDAYFSDTGPLVATLATIETSPTTFTYEAGESVSFRVSVRDPSIRDALATAVLAVLSRETTGEDGAAAVQELTGRLQEARAGLILTQGRVGAAEARLSDLANRLDEARVRHEATAAETVAPDPYETATKLKAELAKLETSYVVMAKRSQLRLTDYLR